MFPSDTTRVHGAASIASGWRLAPLGEVATFQRGFDLPAKHRCYGLVPVVSSAGITDRHDTSMVGAPGVVTGRYGTIGELFYVTTPFWPLNTTLFVRDFHGNDPRFVYYALHRFDFKTFSGKSGVPGVNRNELHREVVAIPRDVDEQRAIADALGDVDALLDALDRQIAKQRDLKQAAMQQLLTGRTRLPGFAGEWQELALGDVANFSKGFGLPKSALEAGGTQPCIHYGELFTQYDVSIGETISRTNAVATAVRSITNDVLMPTSDVTPRGLAKASCVLVDGIVLGGDILIIRADRDRVDGTFLSCLIRYDADQVLRLVTGSTVYHLYATDMRKFQLRLPPIAEQTAIAAVLSDMDAEITALAARRAKTRDLKQAMLQELLTGRTRLVPPTALTGNDTTVR